MDQVPHGSGYAPRLGVEDWRARLEQVKRETREMKAMEAQLKWGMKRDEEKARKVEKVHDKKDLMQWRQDQQRDALDYASAKKRETKLIELQESRDFQETKRAVKQAEKEEQLALAKEQHIETVEHSEWHIELKKVTDAERQRLVIEEHLERYQHFAEHNLEEQQREKQEQRASAQESEEQEMKFMMQKAMADRDKALASLDHFRSTQTIAVTGTHHHPARPANRSEKE